MEWAQQCRFFQFIFEQKHRNATAEVRALDIYQSLWIEISIRIWINGRMHLYFVSDKNIALFACGTAIERQKEIGPKTLVHLTFQVISKVHFGIHKASVC